MEKKEIIYNNLLLLIREITPEGSGFEDYFNSLAGNEERQNRLLTLAEDIETEQRAIRNSKIANIIHSNYEQLSTLLTLFKDEFNEYPNHRISEILLLIELISKLVNSIEDEIDLSEIVNIESFQLVRLDSPLAEKVFFYFDSDEFENSLVLFELDEIRVFHDYLDNNNIPILLNFNLLSKIGVPDSPLSLGQYVLIRTILAEKPAPTRACVSLHLLRAGLKIHFPYTYDLPPNVSNSRKIVSGSVYQQFNDSLIILSEYNYQKDILDKYLRLYHVIENFMYKYPLVKLERKHNGEVFSIRDFQRMYDKINSNELNALNNLFQKIKNEEYDATANTSFDQFIFNKYQNLYPTVIADVANINKLFRYLRFTKKRDREIIDVEFSNVNQDNIAKSFATLMYSYRNSIVHNRETEFHLTHETLLNHSVIGNTAKLVLEEFIIPVLEEIAYYLIIENNEIVWFQNSVLNLWDEE